jgi:guanylate kinase
LSDIDRGNIFVVAAPSGAGKTSLVNALIEKTASAHLSVSHTTRAPRPGEVNGAHYHFVDRPGFTQMVAENQFLEHADVFGNCYGTSRQAVQDQIDAGCDVILEIDWQGARQVKSAMPGAIGIFLLPPSRQSLQQRLLARGQDSADTIDRRMAESCDEISHFDEFDFIVVNDQFEIALNDLICIVRSVRLHKESQSERLRTLINSLLA